MTVSFLEKLALMGSAARGRRIEDLGERNIPRLLAPLVSAKNGFYAFESALHVFPWGGGEDSGEWWNADTLWRDGYEGADDGLTFFAEDAFGFQFAVSSVGFFSFDPETGLREHIANDAEGWAASCIADYVTLTGYPVIHEWQLANGALAPGLRLAPAIPFFLGGQFSVDGMRGIDAVELMRFRAEIYRQTRDLPDGASVKIREL